MKNDLISVIVPIYRVEKYLEQCIQSIRNQTYRNLEIILVDDGSDDNCPSICDRYAEEDKRIKVIHKENGGLDSARKAGIQNAMGKYVGYVDGDDWIEPVMYENLMSYMQQYDVAVVESGVIDSWLDRENRRKPHMGEGCYIGADFTEKVEPKLLYSGVFFGHGLEPYLVSKLFLKKVVLKYQMKDDLLNVIHDDTMVSLPCIAESKSIYVSHNCYYHYRVRSDSAKRVNRSDEVEMLKKYYPLFYERFQGTVLDTTGDRQIKYYALYWLLYKAPYAFDDVETEKILFPYGGIEKDANIVLYGAGAVGIHMAAYIKSLNGSHLVCWADRNYKDLSRTLKVVSPQDIIRYDYDYVVISILRESAVWSAKKDLIALGVPEYKIRWIEQRYIDDPDILLSKVIKIQ